MSRCIIHIGMHKTGTTSIQRRLKRFSNDRFLYGRFGELGNHSLAIYSIFSSNPERHHLHRFGNADQIARYTKAARRQLERATTAARGRTLLISGEDTGILPQHDLEKLRVYFDAHFDELRIVGYVRPPGGFISSSFQQRVQGGVMKSFDPMRLYQSYRDRFEKFDRIFGRDRVQLWKFDTKEFAGTDVVEDFCRRLGIVVKRKSVVHANESLPTQGVAALYSYNKFGAHAGINILDGCNGAALARLFKGEKFRLSPEAIRPVLERNRADIEWMEERLEQTLDENLGEHRSSDILTETDLLRPDPKLGAALRKKLGRSVPPDINGDTPQELAALIHAFRSQKRYFDIVWWLSRIRGNQR